MFVEKIAAFRPETVKAGEERVGAFQLDQLRLLFSTWS
jgi:hypothetical protein